MTTETMTVQQAQELVHQAAITGPYAKFEAAKKALKAAQEREDAAAAAANPALLETVAVIGNTYRNRDALKSAGLKWSAYYRAWIGTRQQALAANPRGCKIVTPGEAGLASMDHADSAW